VRLLAALKILEAAVLDLKKRNIDTTEVRVALDLFEPKCKPQWTVSGFREQLRLHAEQSSVELEGQQQILRVYFRSIYDCVRELLAARIGNLLL